MSEVLFDSIRANEQPKLSMAGAGVEVTIRLQVSAQARHLNLILHLQVLLRLSHVM